MNISTLIFTKVRLCVHVCAGVGMCTQKNRPHVNTPKHSNIYRKKFREHPPRRISYLFPQHFPAKSALFPYQINLRSSENFHKTIPRAGVYTILEIVFPFPGPYLSGVPHNVMVHLS